VLAVAEQPARLHARTTFPYALGGIWSSAYQQPNRHHCGSPVVEMAVVERRLNLRSSSLVADYEKNAFLPLVSWSLAASGL
jgi:hypothetical protein